MTQNNKHDRIDAEKLKAEVERRRKQTKEHYNDNTYSMGRCDAFAEMLNFITSLQQEQQEVSKGKFVFPKYLYARTMDNKTIDISYAPQNIYATEYIRNDFVEQEQSEANLEKEMDKALDNIETKDMRGWFHHFYELGLKAGK